MAEVTTEQRPVTVKQVRLFLDKIKNSSPTNATDLVNKGYVDKVIGSINTTLDNIIGE